MIPIFSTLLGFVVGVGGMPVVYIACMGVYRVIPTAFPGAHPWLRALIAPCVFLLSMTILGVMTNWLLDAFSSASAIPRRQLGRDWVLGFIVGLTSLALLARLRKR